MSLEGEKTEHQACRANCEKKASIFGGDRVGADRYRERATQLVTMYTKTAEVDLDSEHWAITDGEPVGRKDEGGANRTRSALGERIRACERRRRPFRAALYRLCEVLRRPLRSSLFPGGGSQHTGREGRAQSSHEAREAMRYGQARALRKSREAERVGAATAPLR